MNTIRSVWYGWGVLILAGGGAYFFAKRSINADRAERAAADHRRRYLQRQMESDATYTSSQISAHAAVARGKGKGVDDSAEPSREAQQDPAPTRHAPETAAQRAKEKSKYESSEPFRSRKGDRFSGV